MVSPGSSNNLSDFSNINISMNSSMKNMPGNSNTNYGLGDVFRNELEHKIQSQNNEIFEKLKFTLNQLNQGNLKEKEKDIKKLCNNENTLRIFSDFFILNRISKEPNNHDKYFELINLMENKDSKELINYQINDTLRYIHKILMSKTLEDQKERTVLKNLGNWLWKLTLSRNKPILSKDLDFRDLIQNAYEKGTLNVIIPFISKILEHTVNTKVFNLKNPWLNSILTILNSIFIKPGLRPNLKFEIEELFKKFGIKEPNKFPTNNFLDNKIPSKNSQDFNLNQMSYSSNNNINLSNNKISHNNYDNINPTNSSNKIQRINKNTSNNLQDEQQFNKKEFINKIL